MLLFSQKPIFAEENTDTNNDEVNKVEATLLAQAVAFPDALFPVIVQPSELGLLVLDDIKILMEYGFIRGEITQELTIINAFAAVFDGYAIQYLNETDLVHWVARDDQIQDNSIALQETSCNAGLTFENKMSVSVIVNQQLSDGTLTAFEPLLPNQTLNTASLPNINWLVTDQNGEQLTTHTSTCDNATIEISNPLLSAPDAATCSSTVTLYFVNNLDIPVTLFLLNNQGILMQHQTISGMTANYQDATSGSNWVIKDSNNQTVKNFTAGCGGETVYIELTTQTEETCSPTLIIENQLDASISLFKSEGSNLAFQSSIEPDQSYSESTNSGVEWVAKDSNGNVLRNIIIDCDNVVVSITDAQKILFISGTNPPTGQDAQDLPLIAYLENLGHEVTVQDDNLAVEDDANGKDIIVISETSSSNAISDEFTQTPIPILVWETFLYDDLGIATNGNRANNILNITMNDNEHPLSADLRCNANIFATTGTFLDYGTPGSDAEVIAYLNDPAQGVIFKYEKGDRLIDNSIAAARRVGFYNGNVGTFTDDGWSLFKSALDYTLGIDKYSSIGATDYLHQIGVPQLAVQELTGANVGVAVVDSGIDTAVLNGNVIARYNSVDNSSGDERGHGTFMAGLIGSGDVDENGNQISVAPGANIIDVKVLDFEGKGTNSQVIAGLGWILDNADQYNIRVVNMSLMGPVIGPYWDNPLNMAVEALWDAGIVVVVAAGNTGPHAGSVTTPGNDPFVITVGAFTDNYTASDSSDDYIPPFSAAGPTETGFVKPDIIAPGAHMIMPTPKDSHYVSNNPSLHIGDGYYLASGTSSATAVTSGVVALMLEANPALTPNEVKYALMSSADPAIADDGSLAFSIFQQGAGRINALEAVLGTHVGDANGDMIPFGQYIGPVIYLNGEFHLIDENRMPLSEESGYAWNGGYSWNGSAASNAGYAWNGGYSWSGSAASNAGYAWNGGYSWSGSTTSNAGYSWNGGYAWSGSTFSNAGYYWNGGYSWSGSSNYNGFAAANDYFSAANATDGLVLAINSGGSSFTTSSGETYISDNCVLGGATSKLQVGNASSSTVRYEAENAVKSSGPRVGQFASDPNILVYNEQGASNNQAVGYFGYDGDSLVFSTVEAASEIVFSTARSGEDPGQFSLYINDKFIQKVVTSSTTSWIDFSENSVAVSVPENALIKLQYDDWHGGDRSVNIDYIDLKTTGTGSTSIRGVSSEDQDTYLTERNGDFSYSIPMRNGRYDVVLEFAEILHVTSNSREFDVLIEGERVIDNLDIVEEVSNLEAMELSFRTKVTDKSLDIQFINDIGQAKVNGVRIYKAGMYRNGDADIAQRPSSTQTALVGGYEGGNAFELSCLSNEVLVGVAGNSGDYISSVAARCVEIDEQGNWAGDIVNRGLSGGSDGSAYSSTCDTNQVVVGFKTRHGQFINNMSIACQSITELGTTSGDIEWLGSVGGEGGSIESGEHLCANQSPAYGMAGRENSFLFGFSLLCGEPTSTASNFDFDTLGDVNCDGLVNVDDAIAILQYDSGLRTAVSSCPLPDPATNIYIGNGETNQDNAVDASDALLISQCEQGISNEFCLDLNTTSVITSAPSQIAISFNQLINSNFSAGTYRVGQPDEFTWSSGNLSSGRGTLTSMLNEFDSETQGSDDGFKMKGKGYFKIDFTNDVTGLYFAIPEFEKGNYPTHYERVVVDVYDADGGKLDASQYIAQAGSSLTQYGFNSWTTKTASPAAGNQDLHGQVSFDFGSLAIDRIEVTYDTTRASLRFVEPLININGSDAPVNTATPVNIARDGQASQSSDYSNNFLASKAIDGRVGGSSADGDISHTSGGETSAWWELDLGQISDITDITLWNRTNCCANRLANFYVFVSDSPFTSTDATVIDGQGDVTSIYFSGVAGRTTDFEIDGSGRYIRIQLTDPNPLQLAEVEVFSTDVISNVPLGSAPVSSETTIEIDNIEVDPNDAFTVPINIESGAGSIGSSTFVVTFNPNFVQLTGCQMVELSGACNTTTEGEVRISGIDPQGETGSLTVANLYMTAIGGAGMNSDLTIMTVSNLSDATGLLISNPTINNGSVQIAAPDVPTAISFERSSTSSGLFLTLVMFTGIALMVAMFILWLIVFKRSRRRG